MYQVAEERYVKYLDTDACQQRVREGTFIVQEPPILFQDCISTSCVAKSSLYPKVFSSQDSKKDLEYKKQTQFEQHLISFIMLTRTFLTCWPACKSVEASREWSSVSGAYGVAAQAQMSKSELQTVRLNMNKYLEVRI